MKTPHSSRNVADQSDPFHRASPLEGRRVLLAEDSPDQQRLFLKFLQLAGAEVTLECSGDAAVDAVAKSSQAFDAVVMDLELPGMDGIEATQQLRERRFVGAIIALTAHGSPETQRRWFRAGCDAYLEKPLAERSFIGIVELHTATIKEAISS